MKRAAASEACIVLYDLETHGNIGEPGCHSLRLEDEIESFFWSRDCQVVRFVLLLLPFILRVPVFAFFRFASVSPFYFSGFLFFFFIFTAYLAACSLYTGIPFISFYFL